MSTRATELEAELDTWPGIDTEPSRFDCCEFTLGAAEIGRLHGGARVDIPFDKRIRDALLESDVAVSIHRVHPDSGWLTYELDGDESVDRALALLRLSYLSRVAYLQRRGTADRELSLVDVERELESLAIPEPVLDVVRERVSLEESGDESVAAGSETVGDESPGGEAADDGSTGGEAADDSADDGRTPDDGIPSPT